MTITFCNCPGDGGHVESCYLGKRLKIKYSDYMQKIWKEKGPEAAEKRIDEIMEENKSKEVG